MKDNKRLEFKGYYTIVKIDPRTNYYFGEIYNIESGEKDSVLKFYAQEEDEIKPRFEDTVENLIASKEWHFNNQHWRDTVDTESVGCVFDILPDKFRERIQNGKYDNRLTTKVPGGIYEVPLYYVTKAWDNHLKRDLCPEDAFLEIPVKDDLWDDECEWYEGEYRSRKDAIKQNEEMKQIWKDLAGIDIDALTIDFSQFNANLPPKVSKYEAWQYFEDLPYGVTDWILQGIVRPTGECSFEAVSTLMEFVALKDYEERYGML